MHSVGLVGISKCFKCYGSLHVSKIEVLVYLCIIGMYKEGKHMRVNNLKNTLIMFSPVIYIIIIYTLIKTGLLQQCIYILTE